MIDWPHIDTALLDMDGTLLDLAYDNWFWQTFVPEQYARANHMPRDKALTLIREWIHRHHGTLNWYCLDFWSDELKLDIAALKRETGGRVRIRPGAEDWLQALRDTGRRVVMVTNAHPQALAVKIDNTGIDRYFDTLVSSHEYGAAKESPAFWEALQQHHPFNPGSSLLVDDSLPVLEAGEHYGIGHVVSILRPDSSMPAREHTGHFPAIDRYQDVMPTGPGLAHG